MSWNDFPPADGEDINAYSWIVQAWKGTQERAWAAGTPVWPQTSFLWATGKVTGLVNNGDGTYTLTDSTANWPVSRFVNYSNPSVPTIPRFYDLVIDDHDDETVCVHTTISANTATTFTVAGQVFDDALTSKFLPSIASLIGKTYYIIKRGGVWWSERWLVWPNDQEAAFGSTLTAGAVQAIKSLTSTGGVATAVVPNHGFIGGDTVTISGAISTNSLYNGAFAVTIVDSNTISYSIGSDSSPATGTPTAWNVHVGAYDANNTFPNAKYASGYELMVEGSDGALKRITLTGNDTKNLYFARQTYLVSGQYGVIATGKKWRIIAGGQASPIYLWYDSTNASDFYFSKTPTDALGVAPFPKSGITLIEGINCDQSYSQPAFNFDVWTQATDNCNPPDTNYTPFFFRTLHAIQVSLVSLCTFYVQAQSYEGAQSIPYFVPATWFNAAGINSFQTTTGNLDDSGGLGGIDISPIALPYTPINVYFAVLNADGSVHSSGTGACDTTSHLTMDVGSFNVNDKNKQCIISLGFTRKYPLEFFYFYPKQCWIPVWDQPHGRFADPPTPSLAGNFTGRQASSKYKEADPVGFARDTDGRRSFVNGKFARYVGDNYFDPTIHPEAATFDDNTQTPLGYLNNFYEGVLSPTDQAAVELLKSGTITASTRFSIQDTTKNWWPGGVLYTETGTFNSGGTTDGKDSTKAGSGFWGNGSFGSNNFMDQMTLQVTIGGVEYRRQFHSSGSLDLSWTDALPSSANGLAYTIRFPRYEKNRWQQRQLQLTFPDGTVKDLITIGGNDDVNLYFPTQTYDIPAGTKYLIIENYTGSVWQYNGGKWIAPTGTDSRGGAAWHTNQNENLSDYQTDYGFINRGDYIVPAFDEIRRGLDQLIWTKGSTTWTSSSQTAFIEVDGKNTFDEALQQAKGSWGAFTTTPGFPYAEAWTSFNCACYSYGLSRRWACSFVGSINQYRSSNVDFWVFCEVPTTLAVNPAGQPTEQGFCTPILTFNDEGDSVLFNAWHNWASAAVSGGQAVSGPLGTLNQPADVAPAPANCNGFEGDPCSAIAGYVATQSLAVIKWEQGFIYYG